MKRWSSVFMLQNVHFRKLSKLSEFQFGCDVQVQVTRQWQDLSLLHCVLRDLFSVKHYHCFSKSKYTKLRSRFIRISHKHRSSLPGGHKKFCSFLKIAKKTKTHQINDILNDILLKAVDLAFEAQQLLLYYYYFSLLLYFFLEIGHRQKA